MKHITFLRSMAFLLIAVGALTFVGCGGTVYAPKHTIWYYHKELPEADRAIEAARAAGKDKECPAEFAAAAKMRDDAYETYWACHTQEGIDMAMKATAMAGALCTGKPVAKPTPQPAPRAPEPAKPEANKSVIVLTAVKFDFDKYNIKDMYKPELNAAAESILKQYPDAIVLIEGHTDSVGTLDYNQALSLRRANATKDYLVGRGIKASNIRVEGYGETRPMATNETDAGRALNRGADETHKVEIKVIHQ
ncbi:MAG: OmpA family protein [Candidatus Magnetominusculus sp. LBB02]|nr:OmpA family protein [Candidatus Magnetominusculus sp. LBB02]